MGSLIVLPRLIYPGQNWSYGLILWLYYYTLFVSSGLNYICQDKYLIFYISNNNVAIYITYAFISFKYKVIAAHSFNQSV